MSSDIKRAREILEAAIARCATPMEWRIAALDALALMRRDQPAFKAAPRYPRLTPEQAARARELRSQGWGVLQIAIHLGTNQGRVTEAIKGQ